GVPSNVEKGGSWTLQRLIRETQPFKGLTAAPLPFAAARSDAVEVLLETKIDALDITVLKGGGAAVDERATAHVFRLPPPAPRAPAPRQLPRASRPPAARTRHPLRSRWSRPRWPRSSWSRSASSGRPSSREARARARALRGRRRCLRPGGATRRRDHDPLPALL